MDNLALNAGVNGMSKSFEAQKLGASVIEKTLDKSNEVQSQIAPKPADLAQITGKGLSVDVEA